MGIEELFEEWTSAPAGVELHPARRRGHLHLVVELDSASRWRRETLAGQLGALLPGLAPRGLELLVSLSEGLTALRDVDDREDPTSGDLPGRSDAVMSGTDAALELGRYLESVQLDLLAGLATDAGRSLLVREHGETDPGALSKTKRDRWRARTKSVVANELQVLSGYGIQDCHDRVGFALGPRRATAPAKSALTRGQADWWQVWQWWKRCRAMDPDSAADVAETVFAEPGRDDAHPSPARPSRQEFMQLLDREAVRVEGSDSVAARQRRQDAVAQRRAEATVHDDGTGCLKVIGRTSTVAAAMDRIDRVARRARAEGDTRSLAQLRSDATLALLTTGIVPAPGRSPDERDASGDGAAEHLGSAAQDGWGRATVDRLTSVLEGIVPATVEIVIPYDVLTGANPAGVALLTGHGHVTGDHAREIALAPGSTFYRLVTDPATGVLVDRSVTTYHPDASMRAVIRAADRYCRGPGCTVPATITQADHVLEHPAGPTSVSNLASAHARHHGLKTNRWWSCVMEPDGRDLTWTSFFGRIYETRPFDYDELTSRPDHLRDRSTGIEPAGASDEPSRGAGDEPSRGAGDDGPWADLQDRLVYAALAERRAGAPLGGGGDEDLVARPGYLTTPSTTRPMTERSSIGIRGGPVSLTHAADGGQVVAGPPPRQPTVRELVGVEAPADTPRPPEDEPPPF